ncbi:MAG TPA: Plug domain-containing protein [Gemmatimonadaceae bacterium]|nr:Plug domain-containing protein [Gemmatimonadaceae bacterium]
MPLPSDSTLRAARDTGVVRDSVKSPIAVAPRATTPEVRGRRVVWDRDAIFSSGAMTLPELLEQVPGATVAHAGFMAAVTATSWYGEPGRVRVYLDGVELDAIDPRSRGVADFGPVPLWSLEEVAVERTAGELRVHLRSWRSRLTTSETRTDIVTGSENTNLYRGFFGKRSNNGAAFQIAAQQYSTTSVRTRGDGDGLGAFGRFGVARGRLTVDAVASRLGRTRTPTIGNLLSPAPDPRAIPAFEGSDVNAYLRAAWGDADSDGVWMQAVAATRQHVQDADDAGASASPTDVDTATSQAQYIASAGVTRWGARLSATGRLRVQDGAERFAPSLRASWDGQWLSFNAFAEEGGPDSTSRQDISGLFAPLPWVHASATHSIQTPDDEAAGGPARTTTRLEAGVRLGGRWITGGVVRRSSSFVPGLPAFNPAFGPVATAAVTGLEGGLHGTIYGPFSLDWRGIRWDSDDLYRAPVESRTELRVATSLAKKFPRGNFHLLAALIHEYRGPMDAPDGAGGTLRAEGAGVFSSMLDIRIGTANIFWYNRNYNGKVYETVPGFIMPRMVQLYGVRWTFWN